MKITIIDLLKKSLASRGFTGVRSPNGDCGCNFDNFLGCGDGYNRCEPGYEWTCDNCHLFKECSECYPKGYCIQKEKQIDV